MGYATVDAARGVIACLVTPDRAVLPVRCGKKLLQYH
jgi:hypothetical protein